MELFAVEGADVAVAGGGGAVILALTYLGTWVRSLLKDNAELKIAANAAAQTIDVSRADERRKDEAAAQAHEMTLYEQAIDRIKRLEDRDDQKSKELSECQSDRASLRKDVEWLRRYVGAPAADDTPLPSGTHRPLQAPEGGGS